jgi:maltose alpha-D-glucosyltransferase/alpha-amylase
MNYHFPLMPRMFMALQMEDRYPITDIFDQTPGIPDTCQWAIFLRNHDELTLEMVTDEERDYMYQAYARDPKSRINLGIRHRLAPLLDNSRRKIELMNSLLFALPGTPVVYYGDEIGMGDNFYLGDRDGVRTPMQWSPDRNAGFSQANPQKLYLPLILDPEYHYESVNVETQRGNTSSLFWYMKRLVGVRRQHKAFGRGALKFLSVANPKVLSFTRTTGEETLLIVTNLSKFSQAAEIDLSSYKGFVPVDVFSGNRFPVIKEDGLYFFTMGSYSFQWFVLEKAHPEMDENTPLPLLIIRRPEDLMDQAPRRQLENNILSRYLKGAKWFAGKERAIYSLSILDHAAIPEGDLLVFWLLIQVGYQSGQPEIYQFPVVCIGQAAGEKLLQGCPEAVIAKVSSTAGDGLLCDAFFITGWQQALIAKMAGQKRVRLTGSHIDFYGNAALKEHFQEQADIRPRVHSSDQYNISINYDSSFFLKMYRKVEYGLNPDMEIMRFLTGEADFPHIPAFIGAIEWKYPKGTLVLGVMQEMVENHGTGSSYFQERYNNYTERIAAADRNKLRPEERLGILTDPVALADLPEDLQSLLGAQAAEQARLLGVRTAEMHLALASVPGLKDFKPEPFSLHYQRSLFSALQTLLRETYQGLKTPGPFRHRQVQAIGTPTPESLRQTQEEMTASRGAILSAFRRIYTGKLDACKIRVHGNFHLEQILLTGKDLAIRDFDGNGAFRYSERRLKRSPLVDVASMVGSFYQLAFDSVGRNVPTETDSRPLLPFAGLWANYLSGFFIRAYRETVAGKGLIPADQAEYAGMLRIYLLQQALHDLNEKWNEDPARTAAPLAIIRSLIGGAISAT